MIQSRFNAAKLRKENMEKDEENKEVEHEIGCRGRDDT